MNPSRPCLPQNSAHLLQWKVELILLSSPVLCVFDACGQYQLEELAVAFVLVPALFL